MSTKEKAIENHGAKVAKQLGFWCIKLALLGGRGWPDHTVLAPGGRICFIEYKVPGGAFQPLQKLVHRRLREAGFLVAVIDSKHEVDRFFKEWVQDAEDKRSQKDAD